MDENRSPLAVQGSKARQETSNLQASTSLAQNPVSLPSDLVLRILDACISTPQSDVPLKSSIYGDIGTITYRKLSKSDQTLCRQSLAVVVRSMQVRGPQSTTLLPRYAFSSTATEAFKRSIQFMKARGYITNRERNCAQVEPRIGNLGSLSVLLRITYGVDPCILPPMDPDHHLLRDSPWKDYTPPPDMYPVPREAFTSYYEANMESSRLSRTDGDLVMAGDANVCGDPTPTSSPTKANSSGTSPREAKTTLKKTATLAPLLSALQQLAPLASPLPPPSKHVAKHPSTPVDPQTAPLTTDATMLQSPTLRSSSYDGFAVQPPQPVSLTSLRPQLAALRKNATRSLSLEPSSADTNDSVKLPPPPPPPTPVNAYLPLSQQAPSIATTAFNFGVSLSTNPLQEHMRSKSDSGVPLFTLPSAFFQSPLDTPGAQSDKTLKQAEI